MRLFGFTLNVMTLMGLSLAIGMLIDDAIVVRENIVRHLQRGKDHVQAALDGTNEIGLAVMATTFTIVAVFIPVAFMGGMVGQFFYEFGITVAAAVLVSLFVSFTLDPMLSSRWVDPDARARPARGLHRHGARALQPLVRRAARAATSGCSPGRSATASRVVVMALVAFLASFPILGVLGGDFMPDFNRGEYQVAFKRDAGGDAAGDGRARAGDGAAAQDAARRRVHLHHDRRGRHHLRPVTEGVDLRQAAAGHGQDLQPGAGRRARA